MEKLDLNLTSALISNIDLDKTKKVVFIYNDVSIELQVRQFLSLHERNEMVDFVADLCTVDGLYLPALYDFAWRVGCIEYFTNIKLPDDQIDIEKLASNDVLYEKIQANVPMMLFEGMRDAVIEQIEEKKEVQKATIISLIAPDPMAKLADRVSLFIDNLDSSLNNIDVAQIQQLVDRFDSIDKKKLVEKGASASSKKRKSTKKVVNVSELAQVKTEKTNDQMSIDDILNSMK